MISQVGKNKGNNIGVDPSVSLDAESVTAR